MRLVLSLLVFAFAGCSRAEGAREDEPRRPATEATETAPKAPTSLEIVARSEKLLSEHADAPVGTEIPFTLNGQRYVARIELHDNPDGSPDRPPGKHKGVTVYMAP